MDTWFCILCLAFNCFCRILSQSEATHQFPYTPYTNATTFAFFGLCGEHPTLATSSHYPPTTRHTDRHTYSTMESGGRSSDTPHIEVGSNFRSPKELRAVGSKRVPRGWSRLDNWIRRWPPEKVLFLRRPPRGEKGEKAEAGCPSSGASMY